MRKQLRNLYLNIVGRFSNPKPGIHIINSHYVTPDYVDVERDTKIFENYLKHLSKWATFISLEEATKRIIEKNIPSNKVLIAFTFDDGFEECYTVIAPLLEKYNTRGAFFINANYIECNENYRQSFVPKTLSLAKWPMSWKQVIDLHKRGHLIGSHTLDHAEMISLNDEELDKQLKDNKKILEEKLNYKCEYFAWPFGRFIHFSDRELKYAMKYHTFIFSGTNYKHYFSMNFNVLNRRQLESFWNHKHINYFLSTIKK